MALDWGAGAPGAALPEDGFSARYTRVISFPAGLYRFTLAADDGARLWAGDRLLVDEWQAGGGSFSATIWLAGESRVQVETYDESGGAALSLGWTSDSPTPIPTIPGPTATPHPYLWLPMAIK